MYSQHHQIDYSAEYTKLNTEKSKYKGNFSNISFMLSSLIMQVI